MITLAHLRSLLERALTHTENTAIARLTDRTVEGVARAHLPRWLPWVKESRETALMLEWAVQVYGKATLDLTDPGTANALLVALALALGLDPGVGGVGCMWGRCGTHGRWELVTFGGYRMVFMAQRSGHTSERSRIRHLFAPTVAAEPDPIKALALAALHVLEQP
jgi:hypothetical protein